MAHWLNLHVKHTQHALSNSGEHHRHWHNKNALTGIKLEAVLLNFLLFNNRMVGAPLAPEPLKVRSKVRDYSIGV